MLELWVGALIVKCKKVLVLKSHRALSSGGAGAAAGGGDVWGWWCQYLGFGILTWIAKSHPPAANLV